MSPSFTRAADVHQLLGRSGWPFVLAALGINEAALSGRKNLPCPACGGRDRFTFDNRQGRGDFYCRQCGPGSGFDLLMRVFGWDFRTALARVVETARLGGPATSPAGTLSSASGAPNAPPQTASAPSRPHARQLALLRASCPIADCAPAVRYLEGRALWPLPPGQALRAHVAADYWHEGARVGRFAALLAPVVDGDGVLASLHITFLDPQGQKLTDHEPRKLLGKLTGHAACAVRLMPANSDALGIAEGIETALSASLIHGMPVWAALNTSLLAKFEPPPGVHRVAIFADRDAPGLEAAITLRERLDGRCSVETHVPGAPAKDWNDILTARRRAS